MIRLEPGEGRLAWYLHPGTKYPALVMLTGTKHYDSPDVEWVNKYEVPVDALPPENTPENYYVLATDLPGKWKLVPMPEESEMGVSLVREPDL